MRNLVVCLDGTWNTPNQTDLGFQVPSNVAEMARATSRLSSEKIKQIVFYDWGVGTAGTIDKLVGGATGYGIRRSIMVAYEWLDKVYQENDRLFLFGFSRGAYAARSLAGLIGLCGLGQKPDSSPHQKRFIQEASNVYRTRQSDRREADAEIFKRKFGTKSANIHFLGVWDTVGALGLPTGGPLGWMTRLNSGFHDVELGCHVKHARHALAINERRGAFYPTLWQPNTLRKDQTLKQTWFPGVHSNIGGGYVDRGLSDISLLWMMANANDCGLLVNKTFITRRMSPFVMGHRRSSDALPYKLALWNRPRDRMIGIVHPETEFLHFSAQQRWTDIAPPDLPPRSFLEAQGLIGIDDIHEWEQEFVI